MSAVDKSPTGAGRERTSDSRDAGSGGPKVAGRPRNASPAHQPSPAAGAHAADHLVNEDSTPGAGALPSPSHRSGKEVDGGAG